MFKKIVVATDLSEAGDEAIVQGHEIAAAYGAELIVCHVVPNPLRSHMLFPQFGQEAVLFVEVHERVVDAVSRRVVERTGREPRDFGVVVEEGIPHAAIVEQVESCGGDLVVVGGNSAGGVARLLGGTAERVVRHAHCPVLVARPASRKGTVLAATDFSDSALPAVGAAVEECRRRGARLIVMHTIDFAPAVPSSALLGFGFVVPTTSAETLRPLREGAKAALDETLGKFAVMGETLIDEGDPASTILDAARDHEVELVVVGTTGRTGLRRMLLGSVAESVMRGARCSVLVVRLAHGKAA